MGYAFSGAVVSVNWRHFPGTKYYSHVTNPTATELKVPAYNIFDLSARWQINDMYALRFGMENVFNKQPPRVGVIPGVNAAAGTTDVAYDQLGRRFYLGVGANF